MKPRAYVASPLGFTESGRHYLVHVLLPALADVVDPVDPWSFTSAPAVAAAERAGRLRELWRETGARNARAIREADLLVALLDGQEIDSGTAAEVGYAAALGRPCFALRSDLRQSGETGMVMNLQLVAFIEESGGAITASLEELVTQLGERSA
ncbi:MAG TPA: nucleoside 2-deoxyribosyltransferase [Solirubrobacteraceae bacterium]|nr:nucleoside 2-deoxyribosyltransferase [Solirubrobacteraceae bacterium]